MAAPILVAEQFADLVGALGIAGTDRQIASLCHWVEAATRQFVPMLDDRIPDDLRRHQAEYAAEMKRVASDPARALGVNPVTEGGRFARHWIEQKALDRGIDCETRAGAAAVGDIAREYISAKFTPRADWHLRMAEDTLFDILCQTIRSISPSALENLPSNETIDMDRGPAVSFASAFIQIVIDRAIERVPEASDRTRKRLAAILNKSDRRLLDGIRAERQFWLNNGGWQEGELRATVFE
jgi:hypothetical protein